MLRKPLRWLVRTAVLLTTLSVLVFISDIKYDFLPAAIQKNLMFHPDDPIVTDIEIRQCGWGTKCEKYTSDGKVRVDKDLVLKTSWLQGFSSAAYLYVKSVNETEILPNQEVVLDVFIGEIPSEVRTMTTTALAKDQNLQDVAKTHGWKLQNKALQFWVKRGRHVPNTAVSAINVFYGDLVEVPIEGWKLTDAIPFSALKSPEKLSRLGPRIAVRIGRQTHAEVREPLKFGKDGNFKIVQLADLHMSTGPGKCDKPWSNSEDCIADKRTNELVDSVLDVEKPDFVVFSGDQIFGSSSPDPETALLKAAGPVLRRNLPFAMVWGNHDDDETTFDRPKLNDFVLNFFPGAYMTPTAEGVSGTGNFLVEVEPHSSAYPALTLYFLDSHSKMLQGKQQGYDYIKPDQHEWMRSAHAKEVAKLKGYAKVPLSMAFFHIPIPEYREGKAELKFGGYHREEVIGPIYNSGTAEVLREIGVNVVSVGHDHANDFCLFSDDEEHSAPEDRLWLCYGGATGFGGYGGYPDVAGNYRRRVRVFDINMEIPSIKTWHRVEGLKDKQNELLLVNNGVDVFPGPL